MSKLRSYLEEWDITLLNSDLQEIRDIVLEEAGFKWIPVSERLPETDDRVLVTFGNDPTITVAQYNGFFAKEWFVFYFDGAAKENLVVPVKAWMPLPKPYQP